MIRSYVIAFVVVVGAIAGCASESGDDGDTGSESSSEALSGCPQSTIKEWQDYCRTNYCPSIGKRSRGIDKCEWVDKYTQIAHCVCR